MRYELDAAALDRHITGNWGEDQFRGEKECPNDEALIRCDACDGNCCAMTEEQRDQIMALEHNARRLKAMGLDGIAAFLAARAGDMIRALDSLNVDCATCNGAGEVTGQCQGTLYEGSECETCGYEEDDDDPFHDADDRLADY